MKAIEGGAPRARGRGGPSRAARGYTVVELLMSIAVLAIGVSGLVAIQKVTVSSNLNAKNMAIANQIAQSWTGQLEAEAALWPDVGSMGLTPWIAQGNGALSWFRPSYDPLRGFGAAFDALGNPMADDVGARFCVDLNLSNMTGPGATSGLTRAEVRVVWRAEAPVLAAGDESAEDACHFAPASVESDGARRALRYLYVSTALRTVRRP